MTMEAERLLSSLGAAAAAAEVSGSSSGGSGGYSTRMIDMSETDDLPDEGGGGGGGGIRGKGGAVGGIRGAEQGAEEGTGGGIGGKGGVSGGIGGGKKGTGTGGIGGEGGTGGGIRDEGGAVGGIRGEGGGIGGKEGTGGGIGGKEGTGGGIGGKEGTGGDIGGKEGTGGGGGGGPGEAQAYDASGDLVVTSPPAGDDQQLRHLVVTTPPPPASASLLLSSSSLLSLSSSSDPCMKRTVSQESGLSTLSGVSYQPPERTPSPLWPTVSSHRGSALGDVRIAIMKGRLDTVKELYLAGIDLNATLSGGWTALMYACSYGEDDIAKFLLDNGADPFYHKDMFTALMAACASRRDCEARLLGCVQHLVAAGADVNAYERHRMTPLMFAVRENRSAIVTFLLSCGAEVNFKDSRHWTALCTAAYAGHTAIVTQLLQAGADPNVITLKGHTAFDIAEVNGKRFTAEVLRTVTNFPPPTPRSPVPPKLTTVVEESVTRETAKTGLLHTAKGAAPLNNNINANGTTVALSRVNCSSAISEHTEQDLGLFLSGLDLLSYLPLLQAHHVDFHTLLLLDENDLERVGISEIGARKKLFAAILEVHRQPWAKDSLPELTDRSLSCRDVRDVLVNLTAHLGYMRTSLAFVLRQLRKDGGGVLTRDAAVSAEDLRAIFHDHELLTCANEALREECVEVQRCLELVCSGSAHALVPPYGRVPPERRSSLFLLVAVVASVTAVAAVGLFAVKRATL